MVSGNTSKPSSLEPNIHLLLHDPPRANRTTYAQRYLPELFQLQR